MTVCLYLCWKPSKACMIFDRIFPYCISLWPYITINRPCVWLTRGLIWSIQAVLNIYRFNIQNSKGSISVVFGGRRVLWGVCLPVCRFGKCTMYQACLCAGMQYIVSTYFHYIYWELCDRNGWGEENQEMTRAGLCHCSDTVDTDNNMFIYID